jgi:hypothetical protein
MKKKLSEVYNPEVKENVLIDGISLKSGLSGQKIKIATKGSFSSYDNDFQHFFDNMLSPFVPINELHSINMLLVHIKPNNTAYIYRKFPLGFKIRISGPKERGQAVFKHEITDIESIFFEDDLSYFDYEPDDKIIFLFRSGWIFGIYFNLVKKNSLDEITKEIGHLYKLLDYYLIFTFLDNESFTKEFIADGWFPFIALIQYNHFHKLITYYSNNKENAADLEILKTVFSSELISKITNSWWYNPIFNQKKELLEAGINSYLKGDKDGYINSIKVLVTEIEGILRCSFGSEVKDKKISIFLEELENRGTNRYSSANALTFPVAFIKYLKDSIFAHFDDEHIPPSRHAFSHGVAAVEKYNWTRALQIILTIDQIRFFL